MQTRISTKGQVVLPNPIRRKLGLRPGDQLDANVEAGRIVLTPQIPRSRKARIVRDSVTGLPVLSAGPKARVLTSTEVRAILTTFP